MQIAICDDSHFDIQVIQENLQNSLNSGFHCEIDIFFDGKDLREAAKQKHYDAFLLDIDMPEINGFELAQELKKSNNEILFVSNHSEYVFQSIMFRPFRFLRKERLKEELLEAITALQTKLESESLFFSITERGLKQKLYLRDIWYIESRKHTIDLHKKDTTISMRGRLSDLEKQLHSKGFVQVHKGYIVNMRYIDQIHGKEITLENGTCIPIGPYYYDTCMKAYHTYLLRNCYEVK